MTDTEATKPKKEVTPEQKAQRQTMRIVARAIGRLNGKSGADDEAGAGEPGQKGGAGGQKKNTADARKLMKDLTKNGIKLSYDAASVKPKKKGGKKAAAAEA